MKTDNNLNLSKTGFVKNFVKGFFATLSNPYTVGFWLSGASFAKSFENPLNLVLGLIITIVIWISVILYVVKKSSKFISQSLAEKINYICAAILVVFAFVLAYRLLNIDFI
ncbi:MAG: LysE family transporter [Campylobacter sp.]